jgi:hypothetical protein
MPDRPDPATDRLSRFTPTAAGLDRDAILFAAGRRSARMSWLWPAAAVVLAISQAATLVILWPRSPEVIVTPPTPAAVHPASELVLPPASPSPDVLSASSRPEDLQKEPAPASGEYVSSGPTLTVASSLRFD